MTLKYYVGRHVSSSNPHTPMVHVASGILHVPVCGQDPFPHCSHPFLPATILRAIFEDLSKIAEREVLDTGNHIKYVKFARYQINKKIP